MYNKFIKILYIIVIIRIFYIIFTIYKNNQYILYHCSNKIIYNKIILSNVKKNIKSGDIILFSYLNSEFGTRIIGHRAFTHLGIVVEINNKFYIFELLLNDYIKKNQKHKNILLSELDDRITNYNGYVYLMSLKKELTDKQKIILINYINQHKNIKYSNSIKSIINLLLNKDIFDVHICNKIITDLLDDLNIYDKKISTELYNYTTNVLKLIDEDIYYNPIHIIPDKLIYNNIIDANNNTINMC